MLTAIHKKVSTESPKEIFVFPDPWPSSFASGPGPSPWSSPDSGTKFEFCGLGSKNMFFFNFYVLGLYNVQPSLKGIYKEWDPPSVTRHPTLEIFITCETWYSKTLSYRRAARLRIIMGHKSFDPNNPWSNAPEIGSQTRKL